MSSSELDKLLSELVFRRWERHYFGRRDDPQAIGAVRQWVGYADVFILRDEQDATAFRTPTGFGPDGDVFAPVVVSWHYHAPAVWTLRAVLTLTPPGVVGAPMDVLRPAKLCTVPASWRSSAIVRPI